MSDYESLNWVRVQKKTFTRWCNTYLVEKMMKVEDLSTDLGDGILLISLLEQISNSVVAARYNKKPRIRVQKIENVNFSLTFLKNEGIKLVGLGGGDIVDGNLKLILGLIWTIILRYQIQVNEGNSARKELLEWVRSQIPEYNINNFASDWVSGKPICALAEAIQPGQMNLPQDFTSNAEENANLGMTCAEENMGIPRLLDAEDMVNAPDELANMTYIAYFRDYWTSMMDKMAWPGTTFVKAVVAQVQACKRNGNAKDEGGDNFAVEVEGPSGEVEPDVIDNGDGTYDISIPSGAASGTYNINVKLNNSNIKNSPFSITLG